MVDSAGSDTSRRGRDDRRLAESRNRVRIASPTQTDARLLDPEVASSRVSDDSHAMTRHATILRDRARVVAPDALRSACRRTNGARRFAVERRRAAARRIALLRRPCNHVRAIRWRDWALGKYLVSRGAPRVGMTLFEEALQFGGDAPTVNAELAPLYLSLGEYHKLSALSRRRYRFRSVERAQWLVARSTRLLAPDSTNAGVSQGVRRRFARPGRRFASTGDRSTRLSRRAITESSSPTLQLS